ncbi:LD-carboxypeptidase [Oceanobacillus piezotolerans]|uniref:LD-carboxypeptidase n=1 Tax=Oceanobacillus piezotolerans TaxID=2448030 RepID=A0A498D6A1_9BACI|nr:LD-carboxypeptidase [Oceanobacillus piezotolerans]RLL42920.1 LD-carboxypeptidase [Oceanobacillus piezotolerans]
MILPDCLKKGDTIGIVAPASPANIEDLQRTEVMFEMLQLRVKYGKHIGEVNGYLAGTDEQRLADFHEMIADPEVKGVFFARGGYGTGRLASDIDYELIQRNPKIILGYSDITFLHTAIRQNSSLVTFHGPMVASDLAKPTFDAYSLYLLWRLLFKPSEMIYKERMFSNIPPLNVIAVGEAQGQLVGGNLSLLASTLGTPFELDAKGKILLIEDIDEVPYRVDSMLNQLKLSGKLTEAVGIVIGDFANAEPKSSSSFTLEEVFQDYFSDFHGPVLSGFKMGHCHPHFPVPLGVSASLSSKSKTLVVEPGVK